MSTPNLQLVTMTANQAQKEVTFNQNMVMLDGMCQMAVLSQTTTTPPTGVAGARYLIPTGATGVWASFIGQVALYNGGWIYLTPKPGWDLYVISDKVWVTYIGTAWVKSAAAPQTGWKAGTGLTANISTFAYDTATLATLAARVKALEAALFTSGVISL